jgi:iron complex outermembrane recepter protein
MIMSRVWCTLASGAGWLVGAAAHAQQSDTTTARKAVALPAVSVSATRSTLPLAKVPLSVQIVDRRQISVARPTWGLDEALTSVPGVYVANRYNFSQDQRISIRGFGSRSAFAVRGIKVLLDGIPQTLPDGQGQWTNVELGDVDRIEVLRGSASALFGNAAGGVISLWTNPVPPQRATEDVRFVAGRFGRRTGRTWNKWQSTTAVRLGAGLAQVTASRLDYEGERDHSAADLRNFNARVHFPVGSAWSLTGLLDVGDDPRADNPGSLTLAELQVNRDSVPAPNRNRNAGKDVTQLQAGGTLRRTSANGGELAFTVFGLTRDLKNPITTAYIDVGRTDYGARVTFTRPLSLGSLTSRLTAGFDFQHQRDDRRNWSYLNTPGDSATRSDTLKLDQLERVSELGPFVQVALDLSSATTLTAGLRYDWVLFDVRDRLVTDTNPDESGERLMRSLSGSLGIAFNPSDAVTVYGNVGSSFETPTTTELANTGGGFNDSLGPQRAWNYEAGVRGRVTGRLTYSVALFQADVRGELVPYEIAAPRFSYRNAGSSRHRGVELGTDLSVYAGVSLNATWTYSDYRFRHYRYTTAGRTFTIDGRELPGVPQHWLHLTLRVRPPAARGAWIEIEPTYSSGYPVSDSDSTGGAAPRVSSWWATTLRLGWEGHVGRIRTAPFLGVFNAFNRSYVSSVVINAVRGRYYEPAPGRNLYVGLSVGAGR